MAGEYSETEKKTDVGVGCGGFSERVEEIKAIYENDENFNGYEAVSEWIALILKGKRQIEEKKEVSMNFGGYDSHMPLEQYLFLRDCFGEGAWERGSQSVIKVLFSFLSDDEKDRILEEFPNLEYSEPTPLDEQRLEDFIEMVEVSV